MLEVSWQVNTRGKPVGGSGRFRYPIAYVGGGDRSAQTFIGFSFSGPFLSDTPRHGLAEADHTLNQNLVAECDSAVVDILAQHLVPRFGPKALELLQDKDFPASARSKDLILRCADAGALPAASRGRQTRKSSRFRCARGSMEDEWSFIIPAYTWDQRSVSRQLAEIAPSEAVQIHPDCPPHVLETLLATVHSDQDLVFTSFDENDVIQRLQPEVEAEPFPWRSEAAWKADLSRPRRVGKYLNVLHSAMQRNKLSQDHVDALRTGGRLPDVHGEIAAWAELHRADQIVEEVPGVGMPRQVHTDLTKHPVLNRGRLALRVFRLDDFLVDAAFTDVEPNARAEFFDWFLRNHDRVAGATVKAIAGHPVWPTTSGEQVCFDELCSPSHTIRAILRRHLYEPAAAVLKLKRVRRDRRGLLRLRTVPNERELRLWYESEASRFPFDAALGESDLNDLAKFEAELATLQADAQVRRRLSWLDGSHPGVNEEAVVRPVETLHLRTEAVVQCRLRPSDLAHTNQEGLYGDLGARGWPSQTAVYRALKEDPGADDALFPRLAAFFGSKERDESLEESVRDLPFLPVNGKRFSPGAVALKAQPDYWGDWKVPYDATGLAPDRQDNLRKVGVTGRVPNLQTSLDFFRWLSEQEETVLKRHLPQVVRQWLYSSGPFGWWDSHPRVPCLPVYARNSEVRLISYREASSGNPGPLLPDFREMEELILARDPRRRIVIVETEFTTGSILSRLKEAGLRTVRQVVLPPVRISAETPRNAPQETTDLLAHLLSSRIRRELQKRLQELDIPDSAVKTTWRSEIGRIREVALAQQLTAHLKCGSRIYSLPVPSGIDPETGILWIGADQNPLPAVFEAVAERIFEPGSPKHYGLALERAITMDYRSRFSAHARGADEDEAGADEVGDGQEPPETTEEPVEVRKTHRPPGAEETGNHPTPERFDQEELNPERPHRPGTLDIAGMRKPARERIQDPVEKAAIRKLKVKHYASHCQACLADHDPAILAPRQSYGYRPRNRQQLVHAHHVDPVHAKGERVLSNVVLLCKYHHDLLGDQLERRVIRDQLVDAPAQHAVPYTNPSGAQAHILEGVVITAALDRAPWLVRLFFAEEHARIWKEGWLKE